MSELEKQRRIIGKLKDSIATKLVERKIISNPAEYGEAINLIFHQINKAKEALDSAFNEEEEMWIQYLQAESGEIGDYPDDNDFSDWLIEEIKKLLDEKKEVVWWILG